MFSGGESRVEYKPFKFIVARIKEPGGTERNILYKGRWDDPGPIIEHIQHHFTEHSNIEIMTIGAVTDRDGKIEEMRMVLTDWVTWAEAARIGLAFPIWSEN